MRTKRPTILSGVLQTWWVVEKCVDSPESDKVFCDVVGVLKKQEKDLTLPYRQKQVLVLTNTKRSRKGIALDFRSQFGIGMHELILSPIDYKHSVFPGWD